MKFTPGPWHIYHDENGHALQPDGAYHLLDDEASFVARVLGPPTDLEPWANDADEQMLAANVTLMARAPEMCELLQRFALSPLSGEDLISEVTQLLDALSTDK